MVWYYDQMFNTGSTASSSLTSMFPTTTSAAGTYAVKVDGAIQKLALVVSPTAATSLCQEGYIQLICTKWTPQNTMTIPFGGFGLATAPQVYGGTQSVQYFPPAGDGYLNWPVSTAVAITGNYIELFSAVTPSLVLYGLFSA